MLVDLSGLRSSPTPPSLRHPKKAFSTGEKGVYTTTAGPLFSRSVARPRGHRAKKAMVYTIFLGKQGKRAYTIGPERRVYTIEPQTRKEKKRRVSTVVVYTFFFPARKRFPDQALPRCRLVRSRLVSGDGAQVSATFSRPERGHIEKSLTETHLVLVFPVC